MKRAGWIALVGAGAAVIVGGIAIAVSSSSKSDSKSGGSSGGSGGSGSSGGSAGGSAPPPSGGGGTFTQAWVKIDKFVPGKRTRISYPKGAVFAKTTLEQHAGMKVFEPKHFYETVAQLPADWPAEDARLGDGYERVEFYAHADGSVIGGNAYIQS